MDPIPPPRPVGRPRVKAATPEYYQGQNIIARQAYQAAYKEANKERLRDYYRDWREANKEKTREYCRVWTARKSAEARAARMLLENFFLGCCEAIFCSFLAMNSL